MKKKDDPIRWGVEEGGAFFASGPYEIPSSYKGERVVLDEGTRQQLARIEVMLTEVQEYLGIRFGNRKKRVTTHPGEIFLIDWICHHFVENMSLLCTPEAFAEVLKGNREMDEYTCEMVAKHTNTSKESWINMQRAHN